MRHLLPLLLILLTAACSSESSLPDPTGKGSFRAINAIEGSPTFEFLIEERSAGSLGYKDATALQRFDDFEYRFNFEVQLTGAVEFTRVASRTQKIDANQEYTFVISGAVESPTITLLEAAERDFTAEETVFEIRFGHFAQGFGAVDVFFAADGIAPAAGEEAASLTPFSASAPVDVEAGDYVVTVTPAGDPGTIVFQSDVVTFGAGNSILLSLFAPNENDTDPLAVRGFTSAGGVSIVSDRNSSPTVRIFHGAQDLGAVDVYNDDDLNVQLAGNAMFRDFTGDLPIASGDNEFNLTPAGDTTTLLLEETVNVSPGTRINYVVWGTGGSYDATAYIPDRASVQTFAKASIFNASSNLDVVDLYAVETGTPLEDTTLPRAIAISTGARSQTVRIVEAGSYDFYATTFGTRTILAGPLTVDVAIGDVIELMLYDTVDPNVGEYELIPAP